MDLMLDIDKMSDRNTRLDMFETTSLSRSSPQSSIRKINRIYNLSPFNQSISAKDR